MKVTKKVLIVAAAVSANLSGAVAQTPEAPVNLVIQEGFSEMIDIPGAIQEVAIGNPDIIDVKPLTANTFLLNGIERGTTNLIVVDESGRALYRARVHVRSVHMWPRYMVNVVHGTSLGHAYVCDPVSGCPPRSPQEGPAQPPLNTFIAPATVNAGGADDGQAAPAPAGE